MNPKYPLLRCLALYRHMPWRFSLTALLFTIGNITMATQQWLVGKAVHDVERGTAIVKQADGTLDYHVAFYWLTILVLVAFGRGVIQYFSGLFALIIGQDLLFILRERIFAQVQRLDLSYHRENGVGGMVTRTTRDADKLRDALINFWRQVVETSLVIIVTTGMLCWYSPWLGIVPAVITIAGMVIFFYQADHLVQLDRAVGAAYDAVNQNLSEGVSGVRVIKAFGLEPLRVNDFSREVNVFTTHAANALAYATSRIPLPQVVIALGNVWVLAYGAHLVAQGTLNIGELVASMLLANMLVLRIEGIGRVIQIFADARSSAARIWEILDAEPKHTGGYEKLPDEAIGVRLQNVNVQKSHSDKYVLRDLSLQINPGEIVALVGATGSGKSTLMSLLPRLIDANNGVVAIGSENSGWHDVQDLDTDNLRHRVHIVPQESFLFSDTLAANLRLSNPNATQEQLLDAVTLASAEDVLQRLEHGFDTRIGDRGITLSGGQRQRICLARAFLSDASILGFDDATSALDATTERKILHNIRNFKHTRQRALSVLITSSKLSTVLLADRVLVLADGKITAQGTHAELVATSTTYRQLMGI